MVTMVPISQTTYGIRLYKIIKNFSLLKLTGSDCKVQC